MLPASLLLAAWVELGPNSAQIARVVTSSPTCPSLIVDKKPLLMQPRATPVANQFANTVCEAPIPSGASSASVLGQTLPLLPKHIHKVLVIGDTGCTIKESKGKYTLQDCNDPKKWPFKQIAQSAAAQAPDVVIHVGDYHYRESDCPVNNPKYPKASADCGGDTSGDVWDSWNQDFFIPAKPLLAVAPWIFVRGNHEICDRAGPGWFRMLDPRPVPLKCVDSTAPYWTRVAEDFNLLVMDSADGESIIPQIAKLTQMPGFPTDETWLATHRPIWSPTDAVGDVSSDDDADAEENEAPSLLQPESDQAQVAKVAQDSLTLPKNVKLVLNGHQHWFRTLTFADGRAPEIINGNGGTKLKKDKSNSDVKKGVSLDGTTVQSSQTLDEFGFFVMKRGHADHEWIGTAYDKKTSELMACDLKDSAKKTYGVKCSESAQQ